VLEIIKEFRDIKAPLKNITLQLTNFKDSYKLKTNTNVSSNH
jgi:hypothetical protein